nr:hypothetical protein CFP56_67832 [Quercus suber]
MAAQVVFRKGSAEWQRNRRSRGLCAGQKRAEVFGREKLNEVKSSNRNGRMDSNRRINAVHDGVRSSHITQRLALTTRCKITIYLVADVGRLSETVV